MYVFRFATKNQVGFSEWSLEETHTMPKRAAPEEPYIIAKTENKIVSTPYPDRYELLWSAPPNNGEPIDYFEVAYYPVSVREPKCSSITNLDRLRTSLSTSLVAV